MTSAITMRELRKLSAGAIAALPHTAPIRNGGRTVGFLMPLRKAPPELVQRAVDLIEGGTRVPNAGAGSGHQRGPARDRRGVSGRPPSDTLAIDANILVTAVLGRPGPDLLLRVGQTQALVTTPEAEREARRVLLDPRLRRPPNDPVAEAAFAIAAVQPTEYYDGLKADAARCLAEAVASANDSAADAHI